MSRSELKGLVESLALAEITELLELLEEELEGRMLPVASVAVAEARCKIRAFYRNGYREWGS